MNIYTLINNRMVYCGSFSAFIFVLSFALNLYYTYVYWLNVSGLYGVWNNNETIDSVICEVFCVAWSGSMEWNEMKLQRIEKVKKRFIRSAIRICQAFLITSFSIRSNYLNLKLFSLLSILSLHTSTDFFLDFFIARALVIVHFTFRFETIRCYGSCWSVFVASILINTFATQ